MSEHDAPPSIESAVGDAGVMPSAPLTSGARDVQEYGCIVVVGGGCYGSYYVRQLARARAAGALTWDQLVVVDRDPACRVATEVQPTDVVLVERSWGDFFAGYLAGAALGKGPGHFDAIVPSPLMPHLLFDWLVARARSRYPERHVEVRPLRAPPSVPWQRASPSGETHYVSFAEWMCPINCIEPQRCPKTRGPRDWTMPAAVRAHVDAERAAGHKLEGPFVFHCVHRAYGVGMIDVRDVIAADCAIARIADRGPAEFLVGTVSHCHGALGVVAVAA